MTNSPAAAMIAEPTTIITVGTSPKKA